MAIPRSNPGPPSLAIMRVGVTGGTGVLGRRVVHRLIDRGHEPTVLSRRAPRRRVGPCIIEVDVRDQDGLMEAIAGQDAVAHLATSPFRSMRSVEVDGTRSMAAAAGRAGISHLIYVTIVGADRIPLGYYRAKTAAEAAVRHAAAPWTIQPATQFHQLLSAALRKMRWSPGLILPRGVSFQSIDASDVARRIVELIESGPAGRC